MNKKITKLDLAPQILTRQRTAAYARVSCGKDEMLHSLAAQVSFYSELIQSRAEWEYAGVYADEDTPYGRITNYLPFRFQSHIKRFSFAQLRVALWRSPVAPFGTTSSSRLAQSSNADSPILTILVGSVNRLSLTHPLSKDAGISVTPSGIVNSSKLEQPAKADLPIVVIPSGRSISLRELHPSNAHSCIPRKLLGSDMCSRVVRLRKARPIVITPAGRTTVFSALQSVNALSPISSIPSGTVQCSMGFSQHLTIRRPLIKNAVASTFPGCKLSDSPDSFVLCVSWSRELS